MPIVIGIDPGKKGGITAVLDGEVIRSDPMPIDSDGDVCAFGIRSILHQIDYDNPCPQSIVVFVENVHAMKGQGVTSMFTFGRGFGKILGVCAGIRIVPNLVSPQRWKKAIMIPSDGGDETKACKRLFPKHSFIAPRGRVPHSGMQDAALIALYGLKVCEQKKP